MDIPEERKRSDPLVEAYRRAGKRGQGKRGKEPRQYSGRTPPLEEPKKQENALYIAYLGDAQQRGPR